MTFAGNFSSLVDIAFVGFTSYVCWRSMQGSTGPSEALIARWRTELGELERILRSLIDEATTASTAFDRRLIRRKEEIETLLKRAETASNGLSASELPRTGAQRNAPTRMAPPSNPRVAQAAAPVRENRRSDATEIYETDEELPNDTWASPSPSQPPRVERKVSLEAEERIRADHRAEYRGDHRAESSAENFGDGSDLLDDLAELSRDRVSLSSRRRAPSPEQPAPQEHLVSSASRPSKRPVPDGPEPLTPAEERTFAQLSITDPIAFKVARRLLSHGIEIHVVARKLDVPVSEIRMLDRLMRDELRDAGLPDAGPNYKPLEPVPGRKIVRPQSAPRGSIQLDVELTERDEVVQNRAARRFSKMNDEIDRQTALL